SQHTPPTFVKLNELYILKLVFLLGPPRPLPELNNPPQIVPAGSNVRLSCPVQDDHSTLFFEWYKDGQQLTTLASDHFRVTNRGTLKITGTVGEDTGLYICEAVNGFGKVSINVSLIVLDGLKEDQDYSLESPSIGNHYPNYEVPGKPKLIQISTFPNGKIHRKAGSSVYLKCVGTGNPQVSWLKDGHILLDNTLSEDSIRGRWYLHLKNLRHDDSGNYTCVLSNDLGSVHKSFILEVVDRNSNKPKLVGDHPKNTTVNWGETATFQCHVESKVPPHIKWLRLLEGSELASLKEQPNVIPLQGEYFRLLNASVIVKRSDNSFFTKFRIHEARESDSGKYFCLGTNAMGFTFRSAYLTVRPQVSPDSRFLYPHQSSGPHSYPSLSLPFPIIIAVAIVACVVLVVVIVLAFNCRKQRTPQTPEDTTVKSPCTNSSLVSQTSVSKVRVGRPTSSTRSTTRIYCPANHGPIPRFSQPVHL
ncbi:fibroblast growth factor receptor-like 1, partial [Limulus polyphemus]|uniref:Fibroblast growth factor receptor-like 1 n=1 Tax=Limulus polyphemus TaxID=6850 RepID=A0ABM1RUF6_LIMPO